MRKTIWLGALSKREIGPAMHFFHTILEEPLKTPKSQSCFLLLSPPLAGDDGSRDCSTAYFLMMSLHACVTISLLCRIPPYKLFIITAGWFPLNLLLVMVHTNEPRRRPSSPTTTTTLGTMYSSHHQIMSTGSIQLFIYMIGGI